MNRILIASLLFISIIGRSQEKNIILTGVVTDNNGHPVPFAAIQIKNKSIGISANERGEFRFVIPISSSSDTLLISSLGYASSKLAIAATDHDEFQTIRLRETITLLKEVVVKDISAKEILREAIDHMSIHFDKEAYTMESFFRIAVKKDNKYIGLLDAAIDIQGSGFKKNRGLSANLLQLRKIVYKDDWLPGTSLNFRSPAVSIENEFGSRLMKGVLDYSKAIKFWNLELDDPVQQDNDMFYVLKAIPKRSGVYFPYYYATILIRTKDYAIMQIAYDYKDELIEFSKQFPAAHPYGGYMSDKTLLHYNTIKGEFSFTEYNNKLYLSRALYEENGRLSNKALNADFSYTGSFEIFVNRVFEGRTGIASKPISKHDDIFKLSDQYDSTFWANYNKPISTRLYEDAITNLEQNGNLTDQFNYFTSLSTESTKDPLLTIQKESDHFIFYGTHIDKAVIDSIERVLEAKYQHIIDDFKSVDQPVINVRVYPNLDSYHRSINAPKAPAWMIGSAFGTDEFRAVSPLRPGPAHNYESAMKAFVHELTHCVHSNITLDKSPARWLWEAIACYEADQYVDPASLMYVKRGEIPTLTQMNNDLEKGYVYELGYVLIKYIKETWGQEKLLELLQSSASFDEVLEMDESGFNTGFSSYIKEKYLNEKH